MSRLRYFLTDYRTLVALGVIVVGLVLFFGVDGAAQTGLWLLVGGAAFLLLWALIWGIKRLRARRAGARLDDMVRNQADQITITAKPAVRADTEALREKMLEAVRSIKSSRLGHTHGKAALYELPWYVIIGNPAAGKSTAILNSGLQFPFEDSRSNVIQGIGGTRNCDWYFTTEGIVLDTAGRYSVSLEDRPDWLAFLDLLKKNRPRAPINGVILAVSIAELTVSKPEFAVELAKNLRQRMQELTERLEVFVPIYVVFTKADLIAGFSDFFANLDPAERENAWGATLPFDIKGETDALAAFDSHFDVLVEGLKEMALSQLALRRGRDQGPGLLALPLEFSAIKPALRTFVATLFEENPYQFKPVFRGFYFTSAIQEGQSVQRASGRISRQFALTPDAPEAGRPLASETGYFLTGLFRRVIFADKLLVRQYSNPKVARMRYVAFLGAVALLAVVLAGWGWSYTSNRQFVSNVTADLDMAVQVQEGAFDLKSRIDALLILQQRLEQLEHYRRERPISMGFGLYQGDRIERKLRQEYFNGMRQIMVRPAAENLESFLTQVVGSREAITAASAAGSPLETAQPATVSAGERLYQEASATNLDDAYDALKAYLMLGDRNRVEAAHLNSELTRFWRTWLEANRGQMTREDMVRDAERLLSFYVAHSSAPEWPQIETKFALVDDSRQILRDEMKGRPALERVYNDIRTRAATRFPTITVNFLVGEQRNNGAITGNYAISGAFSRDAWEGYVRAAINEASNTQLNTADWVLDTSVATDLTIAGSPEHIAQELTTLYKNEYAREWRHFIEGVAVAEFGNFDFAVQRMNSIGDVRDSPLRALLEAVNRNTIWDNPQAESEVVGVARRGFIAWFERVIMRRNPTSIQVQIDPETGARVPAPPGPIGREFSGFARLTLERDGNASLLDSYFEALSRIRTRLNTINTQGAPGPGASALMQETLSASPESELSVALKLVDEQMLDGIENSQRQLLRALLLRPLTQTYVALVRPVESEINQVWSAQVYQPFQAGIAQRYPFSPSASVEAMQADIEQVFGPNGSIAQFSTNTLGSLVTRRGNVLEPARWAGIGITLSPEFTNSYARWVAPIGQAGSSGGGPSAGSGPGRMFRIQPQPVPGLNEYTIEIDGQVMRYRNTPPQWHNFRWPGPGVRGARINAVTANGVAVELLNAPGDQGLGRMFDAATTTELAGNRFQLSWRQQDGVAVTVQLEIISAPVESVASAASVGGLSPSTMRGLALPARVVGGMAVPAVPAVASGESGRTE
ncbi:MAG: type VI secretion system membrane subunit TssM [Xanthomonadaceae bacterium]|jgi:type VI secretion system protein ImpL|nr:type VI secretion system membrane subunit TssM [Xanthomonadaceae bacterium]